MTRKWEHFWWDVGENIDRLCRRIASFRLIKRKVKPVPGLSFDEINAVTNEFWLPGAKDCHDRAVALENILKEDHPVRELYLKCKKGGPQEKD